MARELPSGTVTFLFTDVEGSTRLLHELGPDGYAEALVRHRTILRSAFSAHAGVEVDTQGDAFFVAFPTAPGALAAAAELHAGLTDEPIRVRAGVHTGTPLLIDEGYVGVDVHRAARIAACGHGGQTLVSSSTAALADGHELVDLGLHRLKDLAAPERIYQLGAGEHPPLKSLNQTNLPIPGTPFLGRERELGEVVSLLEGTRLLTLTGPGGTGKTRLAMQAAALSSDRFPHGVWWVPLAALRDPALVADTIAQTLGAKGDLADFVADKSMLLLLDNFEQVVEAAPAIASLLASCPNATVLVTSREPLRIGGEQEYAVQPLVTQESVGFFTARARAVDPTFESSPEIAELCTRLDDLPLALELAAARVKVLSPAHMLERLEQRLPLLTGGARDLPERQRTLRATIEWSYDLLSPEERELFVALSVFRGGATLEDAEAVVGADIDRLQALVDKSLLRHTRDRFWMLETIREFGSGHLHGDLHERHAAHFAALVETAEPQLIRGEGPEVQRLDAELDNVRAALDHYASTGETQRVLFVAGVLARYWYIRGLLAEGRRRLERAIEADPAPTLARARALIGAVLIEGSHNGPELAEEARAIAAGAGDARLEAIASGLQAGTYLDGGDLTRARALLEPAIAVLRELDVHWAMVFRRSYAWSYVLDDDLLRGRAIHEENLAAAREHGNRRVEAVTLGALAGIVHELDGAAVGLPMLRAAIDLRRELGDPLEISFALGTLAAFLVQADDAAAAVTTATAAETLRREIGAGIPWATRACEEVFDAARPRLTEKDFAAAAAAGASMSWEDAVAFGLARLSAPG